MSRGLPYGAYGSPRSFEHKPYDANEPHETGRGPGNEPYDRLRAEVTR
ncbi:hypothetical protein GCM10009549_44860 [Streptomyces thermoalcalitolerans]|uniref:Uncharacterized protein n=1 Tax=Streptomyces thermoalcalitolerans TaxID=65605 RepID=A0ABP3ZMV0_9ACTN